MAPDCTTRAVRKRSVLSGYKSDFSRCSSLCFVRQTYPSARKLWLRFRIQRFRIRLSGTALDRSARKAYIKN